MSHELRDFRPLMCRRFFPEHGLQDGAGIDTGLTGTSSMRDGLGVLQKIQARR